MNELETLPKGWVHSTLGEVCEPSQYGYTAKAGSEGNYHFLRTTDITKSSLDWDNVPFCTLADNEAEKYVLKDGDIVISRAGSIGYSSLIQNPRKSVFASYLIRFRPLIDNKYLNYFLATPAYWQSISEGSSGIAVQNVNAKTLSAIKLPLAPKNEQTRVVEKLEELLSDLDNGVAELKTAQIKLTQYRQTLLKSAVEGSLTAEWRTKNQPTETGEQLLQRILKERRQRWEQQKLADFEEKGKKPPKDWKLKYPEPVQPDISELPELPEGWVWASVDQLVAGIEAGKSFKCLERPPQGKDFGVLKVSAVTWGEYNEEESKTCLNKNNENAKILIKKGDFLFSRANTTELVGACVIAKKVTKNIMLSDKIWRVLFVEETLKYWVLQYLRGPHGRTQIELSASGNQASMKNISQEKLKCFSIPISSLDEMHFIESELNRLFNQIESQIKSNVIQLKQADAQRKNLLKDAFSGRLVPQDPKDEPASVLLEKIKAERAAQAKLPKPKRAKKKPNTMKNFDLDALKKWIAEFDKEHFTFADIEAGASTDYENLKNLIFLALSESKPVIYQSFDDKNKKMVFKKASL